MIIPDENNKDLEELPDNVADDMTFIQVSHMDEVLAIALLPSEVDEVEVLTHPVRKRAKQQTKMARWLMAFRFPALSPIGLSPRLYVESV